MNKKKVAIQVKNLDKVYKLYDKPSDRLKEALGLTKKKKYKEHHALSNVDLKIYQGETVGIIGTNGSGKSTILKIITGVLNPSAGEVKVKPKKSLSILSIILIILGSPVWLPLVVALFVIILSVYIVLWSVVLVFYSVDLSLAVGGISGLLASVMVMFNIDILCGVFTLGVAITCAGLSVLLFFGSNQVVKGILFLSRKIALSIKSYFVKRRNCDE